MSLQWQKCQRWSKAGSDSANGCRLQAHGRFNEGSTWIEGGFKRDLVPKEVVNMGEDYRNTAIGILPDAQGHGSPGQVERVGVVRAMTSKFPTGQAPR